MIDYLIIAIAASFLLRILPKIFLEGSGKDLLFHEGYIKRIKEKGVRKSTILNNYVLGNRSYYPFLYHLILSLLPEKAINRFQNYTGAVLDTINTAAVFLFSYYFLFLRWHIIGDIYSVLMVSLIFSFMPLLFHEGARLFQASARPLGLLLFNTSLLCLLISLKESDPFYYIIGLILASLIFIASKFSVQSFLFVSIGLSIVFVSINIFFFFLIGFLISVIISGGLSVDILKEQFMHLKAYFLILYRLHPAVRKKNRLKDILSLPILIIRDKKKAFLTVYKYNTITRGIILFPGLIFMIFHLHVFTDLLFSAELGFLAWWFCILFALFIATSFSRLLFLGEPERYLEYGALPFSVIAAAIFSKQAIIYLLLLQILVCLMQIMIYVFYKKRLGTKYNKESLKKLDEIIEALKGKKAVLLSIPCTLVNHLSLKLPNMKMAYYTSPSQPSMPLSEWPILMDCIQNLPNRNLSRLIKRYKIDYILVDKSELKKAIKEYGIQYNLRSYKLMQENKRYALYKTSKTNTNKI